MCVRLLVTRGDKDAGVHRIWTPEADNCLLKDSRCFCRLPDVLHCNSQVRGGRQKIPPFENRVHVPTIVKAFALRAAEIDGALAPADTDGFSYAKYTPGDTLNIDGSPADSLWDQLTKSFSDEILAPHKWPQSMPTGGGRSADSIGKWDLQGDVIAWLRQDNVQERLQAVTALDPAQNDSLYAPSIEVNPEEVLYIALHNAVYSPVNEAAKHLGYNLVYCKPRGRQDVTPSDLRAINPKTQRTHTAHEVKASWGEEHVEEHLAGLMQDGTITRSIARPVAQLLHYMVEERAMYGILSSKRHHTFVKRSAEAASRHVDFSATFDCTHQTLPSIRLMYLYLWHLAQSAPILGPRQRPATAAELTWVPTNKQRKRFQHVPRHISGNHADNDGDNIDSSFPCGNTEIEDKPTHDANIDVSQGTTGVEGLSEAMTYRLHQA